MYDIFDFLRDSVTRFTTVFKFPNKKLILYVENAARNSGIFTF
jgi:hypothetical protein